MTNHLKALKFVRWLKAVKQESTNYLKGADNLAGEFSTAERQAFSFDLNCIIGNLVTLQKFLEAA